MKNLLLDNRIVTINAIHL